MILENVRNSPKFTKKLECIYLYYYVKGFKHNDRLINYFVSIKEASLLIHADDLMDVRKEKLKFTDL